MKKAIQLSDIKRSLNPAPLQPSELDEYFVETGDARDPHLLRRSEIADKLDSEDNVKVLVTGHAGTGKSTELVKFQEEHKEEYAFISFSLVKEAQLSQASIEVLLVLIVETIVSVIESRFKVRLKEKTLKSIYDWFSEAFNINEKEIQKGLEMGGSLNLKDTYLGKLIGASAYMKADIKTGSNVLHRSITKENKRLSELAYQCNLLIKEASLETKKRLKRELVLVIEDLDKISIKAADEIFIQNPAPIADLTCKAIFTAPVWLLTNPRSSSLESKFKIVTIPMIKIREPDGAKADDGYKVLRKILNNRMTVESLIEQGPLNLAIEKTAGVIRQLFDVLITAASTASQAVKRKTRKDEIIVESDIRYGLDRLKSELVRRIGVFGLPEEYKEHEITVEKMFKHLRTIQQNPQKVESDPINLLLLQAHALIEYNGKTWHCVHPLISEHLDETKPTQNED